jgi:hypothetical protein
MKTNALSLLVPLLTCLASLPPAQAVSPPPDGGYTGGNTAEGQDALLSLTTGRYNTAVGLDSLKSNTVGLFNTAVGAHALMNQTRARHSTAVGKDALMHSTGSGNTALGANAGLGVSTAANVICIGTSGQNIDNSCFIGGIYSNVQPIVGTDPDSVTITRTGSLGRGYVSSQRYKHDIQAMNQASEMLYSLKPVSFRYKKDYDVTQTLAFGLIAEEVAEVYPDLVGRNPEGEPESVRYEQINAMLLNEFLKEHKAFVSQQHTVEQQQVAITRLEKQVEALTACLQKVSAQLAAASPSDGGLELSKSAPQTALNDQ